MKKLSKGIEAIAYPKEGASWVEYNSSDSDEKDYYRDVYEKETGRLIYCHGETCVVQDFNLESVTLLNDNIDENDFTTIFTIPIEQFESDFIYLNSKTTATINF